MGTEWEVRSLTRSDYPALLALQERLQPAAEWGPAGSRFLRFYCEGFADSSFVAMVDGEPVGYLLCFVRDRDAYCTALALEPEMRGSPVAARLLDRFVAEISERVDACWLAVTHDDDAVRALHKMLGARQVGVRVAYAGPGEDMISQRIDRARFDEMGAAVG